MRALLGCRYPGVSAATVADAQRVFDAGLVRLPGFTDVDGLRYSAKKSSYSYIDTSLNAWGLYVARHLPASTALDALTTSWSVALSSGLEEAVRDASRYRYTFQSWSLLARARLAVGVGSFVGIADSTTQSWLSMDSLKTKAVAGLSCVAYCRAATAVTLLRENAADATAVELLRKFADGIRVTGRTAYLARGSSQYALDMETQTLVVQGCLLATATPIPELLLQKVVNYIAQGSNSRYYSSGRGTDAVLRALTLAKYDEFFGSNNADLNFKATSASKVLLDSAFSPTAVGPFSSSTPWAELRRPPAPLVLWAKGSGQVNVASSLEFVPADIPSFPIYRGFFVEQVRIRAMNRVAPLSALHKCCVREAVRVSALPTAYNRATMDSWHRLYASS